MGHQINNDSLKNFPSTLSFPLAGEQLGIREFRKALHQELRPLKQIVAAMAFGPTNPSTSSSNQYRSQAILHYAGEVPKSTSSLICSVSGCLVRAEDLRAGHIFQQRWQNLVAIPDLDVNDPANIILMHRNVEKKFDRYELIIMPVTYKVRERAASSGVKRSS